MRILRRIAYYKYVVNSNARMFECYVHLFLLVHRSATSLLSRTQYTCVLFVIWCSSSYNKNSVLYYVVFKLHVGVVLLRAVNNIVGQMCNLELAIRTKP